jgi:hypothetical protein
MNRPLISQVLYKVGKSETHVETDVQGPAEDCKTGG